MPRKTTCFVCGSTKITIKKTFDEFCSGKPTRDCTCRSCGAVWFWDYPEKKRG